VSAYDDVHECNVRNRAGGLVQEVIIPTTPDQYGSRFGKCSCGVHQTKTIPCVHIMVAVVKSSKIAGSTGMNIMPSWCYMAVWREQFGEGTVMKAGFDITYLRNNSQPNPKLRYCPTMAAAEKTGRKKNMTRYKSLLEKGTKKRKSNKKKEDNEEIMMDEDATGTELVGKGSGEDGEN